MKNVNYGGEYYDGYQSLEEEAAKELELLTSENSKLKEYYQNYSNYIDNINKELKECQIKKETITEPKTDERFLKYEKMKKMIPEGAIRQKMSLEGFTQQEIDNFFSVKTDEKQIVVTTTEVPPISTPIIDEKYKKYVDMAKRMIPEGAIRQSMLKDGFSKEEIDDVISKLFPSSAKATNIKAKKEN